MCPRMSDSALAVGCTYHRVAFIFTKQQDLRCLGHLNLSYTARPQRKCTGPRIQAFMPVRSSCSGWPKHAGQLYFTS